MISTKTSELIKKALLAIAEENPAMYNKKEFLSSSVSDDFFTLRLRGKERELFEVLYLDNQHRMIACVTESNGTINSAAVYPREIVKSALHHNAAAIILAHNHPSGISKPSLADNQITARLKEALNLIDVQVLDHLIVGDSSNYSYAANGTL